MEIPSKKSINNEFNLLAHFFIAKIKDYVNEIPGKRQDHHKAEIAKRYLFEDKDQEDYGVFSFQSVADYLCLDIDQWRDKIERAKKEGKKIRIKNQRFSFV